MIEAIGRYRVVRPLGRGGMGQVYLAEDPTLERQVAIKLLLRDPANLGLLEEARTLAAINHANIVTIHEIAEHEGRDFIVMEYVPGQTLRQVLEENRLPRVTLLVICARVAGAIAAAHRAGILHRDVKPENIFVSDDGDVKVLDFGIARRSPPRRSPGVPAIAREIADTLTANAGATQVTGGTQTAFGTPAYMAPELLHGEPASERSDIYSLGVVVHECVAGQRPYTADSLAELITKVIEGPVPRLADPLGDLIERMLSPDPAARPSLVEVEMELEKLPTVISVVPDHRRRWLPKLAVVALCGVAIAGGFVLLRGGGKSSDDVSDVADTEIRLAVAPVEIRGNMFSNTGPARETVTKALQGRLAKVAGTTRLVPVLVADPLHAALNPSVLVVVIDVQHGRLSATVELRGPTTRTWTIEAAEHTASPLGDLIDRITDGVAFALVGSHFKHRDDPDEARAFYREGKAQFDAYKFPEARVWLEAAVQANPDYFDAWYALALVMHWQFVDEASTAAENALRLAPGAVQHELMAGMIEFSRGNYAAARARLQPLDRDGVPDRAAVVYFLGEALWHDGHHDEAYALFDRVNNDLTTANAEAVASPVRIHMFEYWLTRRDFVRAASFAGANKEQDARIDLATGRYRELASHPIKPMGAISTLAAFEILGRPVPEALLDVVFRIPMDRASWEIAHDLRTGDVAAARVRLAKLEPKLQGALQPIEVVMVSQLFDALLVAGMGDEARRLVTILDRNATTSERHIYRRRAVLTAGAVRNPALIPMSGLTYRDQRAAEAMRAELSGDRAQAVTILRSILASPLEHMDLPERAALIRNLRALKRDAEAAVVCRNTLPPSSYRHALLPFLRLCGK